jgi:hypothetical protein
MIAAAVAAHTPAAVATTLVVMGTALLVLATFAHRFVGPVELGPHGFKGSLLEHVRQAAADEGLPQPQAEEALEELREDVEALEGSGHGLMKVLRDRRAKDRDEARAQAAARRVLVGYVHDPEWQATIQRTTEALNRHIRESGLLDEATKAAGSIQVPRLTPEDTDALGRIGKRARGQTPAEEEESGRSNGASDDAS